MTSKSSHVLTLLISAGWSTGDAFSGHEIIQAANSRVILKRGDMWSPRWSLGILGN